MKLYKFTVTGTTPFPLDMLRFNCCWPRTSVDAEKIGNSIPPLAAAYAPITLSGVEEPVAARWESFGWRVTEQSKS